MSEEEEQAGRNWIIEKIHKIADDFHVSIEDLTWGKGSNDFDQCPCSLAIVVGGQRKVVKFKKEVLADCLNTKEVQSDIENSLTKVIKSLHPLEKKIGF